MGSQKLSVIEVIESVNSNGARSYFSLGGKLLTGRSADTPEGSVELLPLKEVEKQHITRVLNCADSLEAAADILGINLSTLWRKRRRYGLLE